MEEKLTRKQWAWFIAIILAVAAVIVFSAMTIESPQERKTKAYVAQEKASVEVLKSYLRLHYAEEGSYPVDEDALSKFADSRAKDVSYAETEKILNGIDYGVRGDGESYQLKYTDLNGEKVTVTGTYKEEYN